MNNGNWHSLLGRIGAAAIFISFGVWELAQPGYWAGFIPPFATKYASIDTLLMVHGIVLLVVGLGFLANKFTKYAAILGTLVLISIVASLIMMSGPLDIIIRDIAILLFTASLIFS